MGNHEKIKCSHHSPWNAGCCSIPAIGAAIAAPTKTSWTTVLTLLMVVGCTCARGAEASKYFEKVN